MPTRNEARKALNKARLPQRDKYIYRALLDVADNQTLEIPDRFQPYRQSDNYVFGTSRRNVQRALADLKLHGWISWTRKQKVRQCGRPPNRYVLSIGWDCDCIKRQDGTQIKRQDDAQSTRIKRQDDAPKSARQVDILPGQAPVLPKGVRDKGEVGEGVLLHQHPVRTCEEKREDFRGAADLPRVAASWGLEWPAGSIGEYENGRAQ